MSDRTTRVRLEAVIGPYEAAMAKAGLATKGLASQVDALGVRGAQSVKSLSGGVLGMSGTSALAAGGVAILGAAVLKFASAGVDAYVKLVEQVDRYQDVTGSSAEESSKMVAIANAYGVEVDTLATSMFRLSKNIAAHSETLAADGVVIARSKDGQVDLTKTLESVGDAYKKVGNGNAGNMILTHAFGKANLDLIDILERTHGELDAVTAAAERHHQIVTDDEITKVREYQVATREMGEALTGLSRAGGEELVPMLTRLAVALTAVIDKAQDLRSHARSLGVDILDAIPGIGMVTLGLELLTGGHDDAAKAAAEQAAADQALADALAEDAAEITDFTTALKELADAHFGVQTANDTLESQLIGFTDATRAAQIGGDKWATSLQAGTTQGTKNREALRGMAKGGLDLAASMKTQHMSQDQINLAMVVYRERLIATLSQLGFNRQEVGSYVDVLLQIPGNLGTVITADTAQAEAALARVLAVLGAIQRAEHFTNLNVLSGRTASPVVDTGGGTSLADAMAGRGPASTGARESASSGASGAAQDAANARDAWIAADDEFNKNMHDHHMRSTAEYVAYLDGRLASERQPCKAFDALMATRAA